VNNKPDLRFSFEPEQGLIELTAVTRTWLPPGVPSDFALARSYWLTRGSRGLSWHRSGRVSRRARVSREPLR
jgi:hypothetical protein